MGSGRCEGSYNVSLNGPPLAIAVPSDDVFYLLWYGKIVKYTSY